MISHASRWRGTGRAVTPRTPALLSRQVSSHLRSLYRSLIAVALAVATCGQSCVSPTELIDDQQVLDAAPGGAGLQAPDPQPVQPEPISPSRPDDPPLADAGGNLIVEEGQLVALDGSASKSFSGRALAFEWQQVEGQTVSLSDPASPTPTFDAPLVEQNGALSFVLSASDGPYTSTSIVHVVVLDVPAPGQLPPDLVIVASEVEGVEPASVAFQVATADGGPLPAGTFTWDFDDGSQAQGPVVNHVFSQGRTLPYLVSVCLAAGAGGCADKSPKAQKPITVQKRPAEPTETELPLLMPANQPPVASAGYDQIVSAGEVVVLDGGLSADPNGDPLFFDWRQLTGPAMALSHPADARPSFVAPALPEDTVFSFQLTVFDPDSTSSSDMVMVYVRRSAPPPPRNVPPAITQGGEITLEVPQGESRTLSLAAVDWDAPPASLVWSVMPPPSHGIAKVASGSPSSPGGQVSVSYQAAGGYGGSDLFGVRVDDGKGGVGTIAVMVSILAPPNQPPVILAGQGTAMAVVQDGSGTLALTATDPDAAAGSLVWTTGLASNGAASISAGSPSSSGGAVTVRYQPSPGYVGTDAFSTVVSDGKGGSMNVIISVSVAPKSIGATWFVDMNHPQATDTGADAGTEARPFKTIQKAAAIVKPGDTVYVKAGRYTSTSPQNFRGVLEVNTSGTADRPITFKRYGNHEVILDAQKGKQAHAVRLGNPFTAGSTIQHVVIDGFKCTGAFGYGINILRPYNVTIRNCAVYDNNQNYTVNGAVSYCSGIYVIGGERVTVERCRVFNNGGGIVFSEEDYSSNDPEGSRNCLVRDNFVYANANSGNYGNSSGISMRFGKFSTIEGNVIYDNPDAAINGLGNLHNRFLRNACINSWQQPGNREGVKFCVRGGGGNLLAFNVSAFNGATGFDSTDGIGDVALNNTFYKNDSWGLLLEGRQTIAVNNISYANAQANGNGQKDLKMGTPADMYAGSDCNLFGDQATAPLLSPFSILQPHTINLNPQFRHPVMAFQRLDPRQIVHPEHLFADANGDGVVTVEEARADIAAHFGLAPGSPARSAGTSLKAVETVIGAAVPEIIASAQKRIADKSSLTSMQAKQAISMWRRLIANLQAPGQAGLGNLSGLSDFNGAPVSMSATLHLGAVQGN